VGLPGHPYKLRRSGAKLSHYHTTSGPNGRFYAHPPDVTFMDLRMWPMDGWEATKRIREMDGGGGVRIIALTGATMAGEAQKALALGCND